MLIRPPPVPRLKPSANGAHVRLMTSRSGGNGPTPARLDFMAGLFSSATLEQIRAASDIVEVIGSYLPLKRGGANFVTLCPFHKEKTASFNVNPHRQIFH